MEDFRYKYMHKLPQFITTFNPRRTSSIDMKPTTVKNCDFMVILYSKPLAEYKEPTFKIGDRVRIKKFDFTFPKGYKPQLTREDFEIVAHVKKTTNRHNQGWARRDYSRQILSETAD